MACSGLQCMLQRCPVWCLHAAYRLDAQLEPAVGAHGSALSCLALPRLPQAAWSWMLCGASLASQLHCTRTPASPAARLMRRQALGAWRLQTRQSGGWWRWAPATSGTPGPVALCCEQASGWSPQGPPAFPLLQGALAWQPPVFRSYGASCKIAEGWWNGSADEGVHTTPPTPCPALFFSQWTSRAASCACSPWRAARRSTSWLAAPRWRQSCCPQTPASLACCSNWQTVPSECTVGILVGWGWL